MSRAAGVTVNSVDLGTQFGFVFKAAPGALSHAVQRIATATPTGADAEIALGAPRVESRELQLEGSVIGVSVTDLETRLDALKRWLANGTVVVSFRWDPSRELRATLEGMPVVVYAPAYRRHAASVIATLRCQDPMRWAIATTSVALSTVAAPCALGTAISRAVLTIPTPAANLVVTLRNAAGTTLETMGFTLTGTPTQLVIDCVKKQVTKTVAGVDSSALGEISSGTHPTFLALDPQDGDQLAATWPSLALSSGTGTADYFKRWR